MPILMAAKSHFEPFDAAVGNWGSYLTRFEFFLAASDIASDEKRHSSFLTCVGQETFHLAQALVSPAGLGNTPFSTIEEKLKQHLTLKRSVIACCHSLYKWDQMTTETIAQYVVVLRLAAHPCAFKNLETALQDRFICSLRNMRLQQHLFEKQELNFQAAVDEALAAESTKKHTADDSQARSPPSLWKTGRWLRSIRSQLANQLMRMRFCGFDQHFPGRMCLLCAPAVAVATPEGSAQTAMLNAEHAELLATWHEFAVPRRTKPACQL